jgi:hypothetical protein
VPMRAITTPSTTLKLSTGFTNEPKKFQRALPKREGGAKMIDISEIPQPLKRRRGTVEIIEPKPVKPTKEERKIATTPKKQDPLKNNIVGISSGPAFGQGFGGGLGKSELKEEDNGPYQPLARPGKFARSETIDSEVSTSSMKDQSQSSGGMKKINNCGFKQSSSS